jgi:hypothetical protein
MSRLNFLALMIGLARRRRKPRRRPEPKIAHLALPVLPSGVTPRERRELLTSFRDADIETELRHRLLSMYSVEELRAEADRRGIG